VALWHYGHFREESIGRGLTQGQMASVEKMEAFCLTEALWIN